MEEIIRKNLKIIVVYLIVLIFCATVIKIFVSKANYEILHKDEILNNQDSLYGDRQSNSKNINLQNDEYLQSCIMEYKKRIVVDDVQIRINTRKNLAKCFEAKKLYQKSLKLYIRNYETTKSKADFTNLAKCLVQLKDYETLQKYLDDYLVYSNNLDDPEILVFKKFLK